MNQKNNALLIPLLALTASIACCGKPDITPANKEMAVRLCRAIKDNGFSNQCQVNFLDGTIGILIDTDDEKARNLCPDIVLKIKALISDVPAKWKLQIFSPYREDKPLAACFLD